MSHGFRRDKKELLIVIKKNIEIKEIKKELLIVLFLFTKCTVELR